MKLICVNNNSKERNEISTQLIVKKEMKHNWFNYSYFWLKKVIIVKIRFYQHERFDIFLLRCAYIFATQDSVCVVNHDQGDGSKTSEFCVPDHNKL